MRFSRCEQGRHMDEIGDQRGSAEASRGVFFRLEVIDGERKEPQGKLESEMAEKLERYEKLTEKAQDGK